MPAEVMVERMERVRRLLASERDYLPPIRVSVRPDSGPAASRRVPCGLCHRTGRIRGRLCPLCEGGGWRKRRAGEEEWDEYLRERVETARKRKEPARPFRLDEDIRRLGFELERLTRGPEIEEGWERALRERERQERAGSYGELRGCLLRLEEAQPLWYGAIRRVWLIDLPVLVMPRTAQLEMLGVAWLAREMGEIRLPEGLELERRRERRADVIELHELGWKPARIARALSLSQKKVKRVLRDRSPSGMADSFPPEPELAFSVKGAESTMPVRG